MVHVRSNALRKDFEYRPGMSTADAMAEAEVRKTFLGRVLVNGEVVGPRHVLNDEDTVTVVPWIKNG